MTKFVSEQLFVGIRDPPGNGNMTKFLSYCHCQAGPLLTLIPTNNCSETCGHSKDLSYYINPWSQSKIFFLLLPLKCRSSCSKSIFTMRKWEKVRTIFLQASNSKRNFARRNMTDLWARGVFYVNWRFEVQYFE